MSAPLTIDLDALVEQLAVRVAERILDRLPAPADSPWLDVQGAADHLCCSKKRIYDLHSMHRIPVHRDGSRLLFHRDELDAYLRAADRRSGGRDAAL